MKILSTLLSISFVIVTSSCATKNQFVQTELYFGLSQNNGNIITDSAWNIFVQRDVSKVFSEGFTVIESQGKWVDTLQKKMHGEPSRIISSVGSMNSLLSAKIDTLREKYKTLFQQEAVLRVDKKVSIDF